MAIWPTRRPVVVGQRAAHIKVEAGRGARRRLDVGDLATGVEALSREDGDFVRIDGRVGPIESAGDRTMLLVVEIADALVVIPLGLPGHVDGEVSAMRALNDEGLAVGFTLTMAASKSSM